MSDVDMGKVDGKSYRKNVEKVFGKDMAPLVHDDMRRMLGHKSGTPCEDIYAYDLDTGIRIGSETSQRSTFSASIGKKLSNSIDGARDAGHRVVIMHNHPGSSMPSLEDIRSVRNSGASFGVIACHDGSIINLLAGTLWIRPQWTGSGDCTRTTKRAFLLRWKRVWGCELSVLHEVEKQTSALPDDDYGTLFDGIIDALSDYDARLYHDEVKYALELQADFGKEPDFEERLEQKIMERFAEEEAARP